MKKQNFIVFTDPNKDTDDLINLIMLNSLSSQNKLNINGIVVTHGEKKALKKRAKYTSGILNLLGNKHAQVCVGIAKKYKDKTSKNNVNKFFYGAGVKIILKNHIKKNIKHNSLKFLKNIFENSENLSLDILVIAEMTDLANFIKIYPQLFQSKVSTVNIMGGIITEKTDYLMPTNAANNANDMESAVYVHKFLIEKNIKTIIVDRFGVMKIQFDKSFYEKLKNTNHFVGKHANEIQNIAFSGLYVALLNGESLKRQTPEWFYEVFTDIKPSEYESFKQNNYTTITKGKKTLRIVNQENVRQVINRLTRYNLYDPLTLVASIDEYKQFFKITDYDNFSIFSPDNKEQIYQIFNMLTEESLRK